jgi:O-antigen/teichoic acid export membrane protein
MDIIQRLFFKIRNSEIIKNVFFLLGSNGLAQLFPFLIYPFITRLYSPNAFGQLAILISVHSLIVAVASGKYDQAITLPKDETRALHLFNIGLRIAAVVSLLIIPVVFVVQWAGRSFSIGSGINNWFYLLGITVFTSAYLQLINGWSLRHKMFKIIVGSALGLSFTTSVLKLILGLFKIENGLIVAFVMAQFITALYIYFRIRKSRKEPGIIVSGNTLLSTAREYINFPKFNMINALLNAFSSNLPIYAFAFCFSENVIGQFSVAMTLMFTPVTAFNNSVNQVLMQRTVEMRHSELPVWPLIKKYITRTLLLSSGPGLLLIILIPFIVNIYLGSNWSDASRFCQYLIPYAIGVLVSGSLAFIPNIFNKQLKSLLIYIVYLIVRIVALGIGILLKNINMAVGLYALVSVMAVAYQVFWYRTLVIESDRTMNNEQ